MQVLKVESHVVIIGIEDMKKQASTTVRQVGLQGMQYMQTPGIRDSGTFTQQGGPSSNVK